MLQKLSIKTGLTKTEIRVIFFLLLTLAAGSFYTAFFDSRGNSGYNKFDYAEQDSLFLNSGNDEDSTEFIQTTAAEENLSSSEILGLNKKQFSLIEQKKLPGEKSINLNTADLPLLTTLPGIGRKTALQLLEFRKRHGKFSSYNDLLQVKGIGKVKLEKIKKYSYIK